MQQSVNKDEFYFDIFQPNSLSLNLINMQKHIFYTAFSTPAIGFGTTFTTTTPH
jgi:hypothetical protein